jgi:hypothetical protein
VSDDPSIPEGPEGSASTAEGLVVSSQPTGGLTTSEGPPLPPGRPAVKRYTGRFAVTYLLLGVVLALAVGGFIVLLSKPGQTSSSSGWSSWKPKSGTVANVTSQIANHVAHEYRLNSKGTQLVAVVSDPPQVASGTHDVAISHIAIRKAANSTGAIQVLTSASTWTDQFCGLGTTCSIASGKPTVARGRLVRREALEVALYTFKFVPKIDSVIAFMPPPPGETTTTLLYLQKSAYAAQLSQPLDKTFTLAKPPLPTSTDTKEAATIDKLTLPSTYSYTLQQLQDSSALLVLTPLT